MRVKSFTIIELIVVLVLSSTVMLLTLWFFSGSYSYFYKINSELADKNKTLGYINRMEREMELADYIDFSNRAFNFYSNDSLKYRYYLEEDWIIREYEGEDDTLYSYISNVDTMCVNSPKGLVIIKDIIFTMQSNADSIPVHLHKEYYSKFKYLITTGR